MSIRCKCLNIVVTLVGSDNESHPHFDLDAYLSRQKRPQQESATTASVTRATTPSDDHFLFFKEALGPVQCSAIEIQFDGLLQKVRVFEEWDLSQCRNCACCVYARNVTDTTTTTSTTTCLVNATLLTNQDQLNARMADKDYSPAFGILLDPSTLTYSDLAERNKMLGKSDNRFVNVVRAYMERETEASNERIHRFTEQEFAGLKVKRERAEQDCHILTKLARNVPDLLANSSGKNSTKSAENSVRQSTVKASSVQASDSMSPMAPPGTKPSRMINLNDSSGSQLETPPPTPEYLPMSTGNSPPMSAASSAHGRRQTTTPSSSSSMSAADQSSSSSPVAKAAVATGARITPRANHSYSNGSNNNNNASFNNTRGAINRQPPTTTAHQHSSTNAIMMQRMAQSSFESECMFDIDGMENDKSPPSNTPSDEEELGFDESISNNNDDGMYIPPRQYGRQISSIAKSLPISMPQAMAQFRTNEEDFDELTEDNVDIAASIKALAKSVHGDTVFGDLPRPQVQRFSTQI
ncbi:uncharacterized protein LOC129767294 [Toxorhynchites rutilus septentrionalis]|uniref:uncharacterized protein LOC129767294 n=1 Tax=Toxorhynchites rutilus septentrionalis TaxID=329112 RepID=UPI0024790EA2|nr:uncharacterized protein LOC129767294 [Toxorhynchites rutilus septentrionalis]